MLTGGKTADGGVNRLTGCLSNLRTVYKTPELRARAENNLEHMAYLWALGLAKKENRDEAIRVLDRFVINDTETKWDPLANYLMRCLKSDKWKEDIEGIKYFPGFKKGPDGMREIADPKYGKYIGVGGTIVFAPQADMIAHLLTLGRLEDAKVILSSLKDHGDKLTNNQRQLLLTTYGPAVTAVEGKSISDEALSEKFSDGQTLREKLSNGNTVVILRAEYWCPPCVEELRYLSRNPDKIKNIKIVVVTRDKPEGDQKPVQELAGSSFPQSVGSDTLTTEFPAPQNPITYVVAPNLKLAAIIPELKSPEEFVLILSEISRRILDCEKK